jgi:hypothetical protein
VASTTCDIGSYWSRVRCELEQPAWLSDVGIPMVATLIGLALAVLLVRSQIANDRRLRHADRLSPSVAEFGRVVLDAVDKAWNTKGDDPYWDAAEWDGHLKIYRAQGRLAVTFAQPDVCNEVVRGSRDVAAAWTACVLRRRELEERGVKLSTVAAGLGIDAACTPLWNDLRNAAEVLTRWDGLERLPDFSPWPHPHVEPAGPKSSARKKEARRRWLKYYADEFERVAVRHNH